MSYFKNVNLEDEQGRKTTMTTIGALNTYEMVRIVGTNFNGTTKDTNFWTELTTGSGEVVRDGHITLTTGAVANSSAKYSSVRAGRYIPASINRFISLINFVTSGTTNNVRRIGVYNNDGFFFQLSGTTFSIGCRKAGVDTLVSSGDFNGEIGTEFTPETDTNYKMEIEYTPKGIYFFVDKQILHSVMDCYVTKTLILRVRFENINSGDSTIPVSFLCGVATIVRLGKLFTNPHYKYVSGATTIVLKYSAGFLHRIINNDNAGSYILYDGVSDEGVMIASIDCIKVLGNLEFKCPFSDGLTIVTTDSSKLTIIYE